MSDTRREITQAFYLDELHLYRAGTLAYVRMLRKHCRSALMAEGAFGPFGLTIRRGDGRLSPHVLVMWEAY